MHISFRSLLYTDRAVIRRVNWVRVHLAGPDPVCYWLEFDDKRTAKRAGRSILTHIREQRVSGDCDSDIAYNELIYDWIEQLRRGNYIKNLRQMEANSE